jgi:molecular chaperone DnaK
LSRTIGIDFGTTSSRVSAIVGGRPSLIPNPEGALSTPSVVGFTDGEEALIGEAAVRLGQMSPNRVVASVKRLLGRGAEGGRILAGLREYSATEVAAHVLRRLKGAAEACLGEPVGDVVLTVPPAFEEAERAAIGEAAALAGLRVARLLSSPLAAALAYGLKSPARPGERLAVCDFGGGSFGIAIVEAEPGRLGVRGIAGDAGLGGDDFDQRVVRWIAKEFAAETSIDLGQYRLAQPRLKQAAEAAKREMATSDQAEIALPHIAADGSGPRSLRLSLARETYEGLTALLLEWAADVCRGCLASARLAPEQIDQVLLVGGQSRDRRVPDVVRGVFGRPPRRFVDDGVVAVGAAVQAGILEGRVEGLETVEAGS